MKIYFCIGLVLLITIQWTSANQTTSQIDDKVNQRLKLIKLVGRRLRSWWISNSNQEDKETFVGRCFGVAKKIKQLLPIIVFKLGVIMTILGFLTLFSLKSLALLGLLLLLNTSGAAVKVASAFAHKNQDDLKKQNIHLHFHQNKHGYHLDPSGYDWDERIDLNQDIEKTNSFNLYDKLLKHYKIIGR